MFNLIVSSIYFMDQVKGNLGLWTLGLEFWHLRMVAVLAGEETVDFYKRAKGSHE